MTHFNTDKSFNVEEITIKQYVQTGFNVFDTGTVLSEAEMLSMSKPEVFDSIVKAGAAELITNNNTLDFGICCSMLRVYLYVRMGANNVH